MKVIINYKNHLYFGLPKSVVVAVKSRTHLDNYIAKMERNNPFTKVTGWRQLHNA